MITRIACKLLKFPLFLLFFIHALLGQDNVTLKKITWQYQAMGTSFQISCYTKDSVNAKRAFKSALVITDSLNHIFSDYDPGSEINKLTKRIRKNKWVPVSNALFDVIKRGEEASRVTNGAFDITIGRLTRMYRKYFRIKKLPPDKKIKRNLKKVGFRFLEIDSLNKKVKITRKGLKLDLGGIAKGYTADRIYHTFQKMGINTVLVDAGGDLTIGSAPPDKKGWNISLMDMYGKELILSLANCGIATSGSTYRYFIWQGEKYTHIVDPRTGYPVKGNKLSTVIAKNGISADCLASAFFVLNTDQSIEIAENTMGVEAQIMELCEHSVKTFKTSQFIQFILKHE